MRERLEADVRAQVMRSIASGDPVAMGDLAAHLLQSALRSETRLGLDEGIDLLRRALDVASADHPDVAIMLSNLGGALLGRYERNGAAADLNEAVQAHRRAVEAARRDDPRRAALLSNFGLALRAQFDRTMALADLEEAIDVGREAVKTAPPGHPGRVTMLSGLCAALMHRFEQTGSTADLDEAIEVGREAVQAVPPDHFDRATVLASLGAALLKRFERTGAPTDLEEAIEAGINAAAATPRGRRPLEGGTAGGDAVMLAAHLTEAGRHADARALLESVPDWPTDILGFEAFLVLARCYRAERDFDAARRAGFRALQIAELIARPDSEAVALEALALIEAADDRIGSAAHHFMASAALEGRLGNIEGRSMALSNYANMLIHRNIEGAEPLLLDALTNLSDESKSYALVTENLAAELYRQGRYGEAVTYAQAAVECSLRSGQRHDAYFSLRTLSAVLAGAGRNTESGQVFQRAHDLIRDLRNEEVDQGHYAKYPERVAAIQAEYRKVVENSGVRLPEEMLQLLDAQHTTADAVDITIGLHAEFGKNLAFQAQKDLEAGKWGAAIRGFLEARHAWQALHATHRLLMVDYYLASAYLQVGDIEKAISIAFGVRAVAHELGDAHYEMMALAMLGQLCEHMPQLGPHDELDYLLQARALEQCVKNQIGQPIDSEEPISVGALTSRLAIVCTKARAYDLAEIYFLETLAIARDMPLEDIGYRLFYRLSNYNEMLRSAGRPDDAVQVLAEMRSTAARLPHDPRIDRAVALASWRARFDAGERTHEVLDSLLDQCRAYEQARDQARGLDLTGFAQEFAPPYIQAAEVALTLGLNKQAWRLLEQGKARTVLEVISASNLKARLNIPPAALPGGCLSLLVTSDRIALLGLDDADAEPFVATISLESEAEQMLPRAVRAFAQATAGEIDQFGPDVLDAILDHPAFRRLADAITASVPQGKTAWLVPHSYLHYAPVHLLPLVAGTPARYSVVPSLAVAGALPQLRIAQGRTGIVALGDATGDLPFARAEARLAAGAEGSIAVGGQCTLEWLQESLRPKAAILHIACHGRFDSARPMRSGLVLAAPEEAQLAGTTAAHLLTLPEVARLPLDGMIVVLSACSSGMEKVGFADEASGLLTALLTAGAASVIAAQWPVNDLSAMLVMTSFHRRLAQQAGDVDLLTALEAAAREVRDMTTADLVESGFTIAHEILRLGGTPAEASQVAGRCLNHAYMTMEDRQSAELVLDIIRSSKIDDQVAAMQALRPSQARAVEVQPFAHPWYWGAFKVVGRSAVSRDTDGSRV
jgi:CHAT domain-containing protein/tetratricopeptide (TPR) repeat protein